MAMLTPFGELLRAHAANPRAPAALSSPRRDVAYAELVRDVGLAASWLRGEGCVPGVPVGVSVADETDGLVVTLALLELGVPQVGLPTHLPETMRQSTAQRISVGRVVVADRRHALPGIATSVLGPFRDRRPDPSEPRALDPDPDAPALFTTSSGTTGLPKILALSQRVIVSRGLALASSQAFAPDERMLVAMATQEYPGRSTRLYVLCAGCTAIDFAGPSSTLAQLPDYVAATRTGTLLLTVQQARTLVAEVPSGVRLPPETRVLLGASPMPRALPALFEAQIGGRVYNRYGTTEIGLVSTMYPDGDDGTPDSVGRPVPGVDIEIVDRDGNPVPRGEAGSIRLRSSSMVHRYYDDEATSAKHFIDGWFHPGDAGAITPDGVLRFLGRVDDMMMLHTINIFPAEIERVLEEHPAVASAAAFPIPSPFHGEIPAAAVELKPGATADAAELSAFARERLGVRAPRKIAVMEALPRNSAGKVLKRELAKTLAAPATRE